MSARFAETLAGLWHTHIFWLGSGADWKWLDQYKNVHEARVWSAEVLPLGCSKLWGRCELRAAGIIRSNESRHFSLREHVRLIPISGQRSQLASQHLHPKWHAKTSTQRHARPNLQCCLIVMAFANRALPTQAKFAFSSLLRACEASSNTRTKSSWSASEAHPEASGAARSPRNPACTPQGSLQ